VRERGNSARFGLETAAHVGIRRDARRHDLDRHVAIEPRIAGAIDLAHAAGANPFDDFVLGDA
jgi:hypothetical protein